MQTRAFTRASSAVERVMVVASDAAAMAPVCLELMRRGASVSAFAGVQDAATSARQHVFDVILVSAREDANATALFLKLIKAEALGSPRVLLIVDPERANDYGLSIFQADEMLAATLRPERIADATGIGIEVEAPAALNLPAVYEAPKTRVLALPAGISRDLLPQGVVQIERGEVPDAVILTAEGADAAISAWMSAAAAAVVPIVAASGRHGVRADATIATLSGHGIAEAIDRVKPLTTRMRQLPETYFRTHDTRQMLLARLAVRDRKLEARRDPGAREIIRFRDETAIAGCVAEAEALSRVGLLKRVFFEKVQCCVSCASARVLVREECSKCRSADIAEEPIIHHLRCGFQGPERDFRRGRDLICPKCTHHLEHFSVDYDKPGQLVICNGCGHTTGEPEVGFKCLDCETGFPSAQAKSRVFHEYELTDAGRETAFAPPLGGYGDAGAEGAGSLRDRLRRFTAANATLGYDCAALLIKVDGEGTALAKLGQKAFNDALALYASVLRELFEKDVEIIEAATTFLVLISNERKQAVETAIPEIRRELEQHLAANVEVTYHVFAAEEIATLL